MITTVETPNKGRLNFLRNGSNKGLSQPFSYLFTWNSIQNKRFFKRTLFTTFHYFSNKGLCSSFHSPLFEVLYVNEFLSTWYSRLMFLFSIASPSWSDEDLTCDTGAPGCAKLCTNEFFPFSPIHLWELQMIAVMLPGSGYTNVPCGQR